MDKQNNPLKLEELPEIAMHGPVEVSMVVHVMTPEGKSARITMSNQVGVIPEQWDLAKMMGGCLFAESGIPDGTRFMSKPEFVAHITKRETGQSTPMVGNQEFEPIHKEATLVCAPKMMLIDAVLGRGFKPSDVDRMEEEGILVLQWDREELEKLDEAQLLEIYNEITGG